MVCSGSENAMFARYGISTRRDGAEDVVIGHIAADSARKRTGQVTKPIAASRCNWRRRSGRWRATITADGSIIGETVEFRSREAWEAEVRARDDIFRQIEAESLRRLQETMPPGVHVVGYDGRGWLILDALWSGPGVKTTSMEVNAKPLELVLESSVPLRVYVNPELTEFDEWEKPLGSGTRMLVGTPMRVLEGIPSKNRRQRRSEKKARRSEEKALHKNARCTAPHHCIPLGFSAMAGHSRNDAGAVSPRWRCISLPQANGAKFSGGAVR